jgi:putative aldouronate transport system substrate-binding protein
MKRCSAQTLFDMMKGETKMKTRFYRKPLTMVMSLAMLSAIFTGCASKADSNQTEMAKPNANLSESGYPITKTPITLKVWAPINANATQFISNYGENEAYQEVEKRTGIHIEWIHPVQGQEKEAFNLMIASGELPDVITGAGRYIGGEAKGVRDGVFEDLTPYLQKYAPDYYKLVTSDPETKREATDDSGKFPAFYMIKPEQDAPSRRIMLRKEMLDQVHMDIPKTIADYEKMFKAVKDAKGIAPYILLASGVEEQFIGPFGILNDFYLKDSKTVQYGQIQPEFKQYLELMNKWYQAGYINKDFAGLKTQQQQATFDSGKAEMMIAAVVGTYNRGQKLKQDYVSAPFPRINAGDKIHYWPVRLPVAGASQETVISTTSKHKIEAIRWLNYAYTKEGSMLYNYGIEGKTYTMVNGKPKFTDYILNNPKLGTENTNYILKIHFAPKLQCLDVDCNPNLAKSPESAAIRAKWADDPNADSALRLPPVQLTSEETDQRSKIMTEVNTYVDEMVLKFIIGAEPLSNFDAFVSQVKKLGIDQAVKITQSAYDRYSSKK